MADVPLKLLVIEDDEGSAHALDALITLREGWEVSWAATLDEARAMLSETQFDAVLLDLKLSGEDGEDLIDEIRDECPRCRVVVVTGLIEGSPRISRVASKQPNAIIHKPYEFQGLMTALRGENPFPEK